MKNPASKKGRPSTGSQNLYLLLAFLGLMPLLVGAGQSDPDNRVAPRRHIAAMSQSKRDRLRMNFETYQRLKKHDPEQLRRYRELHRVAAKKPDLQTIMITYHSWLRTLSLWQQEELRQETDTAKRLELVRTFIQDQRRLKKERNKPFSSNYVRDFSRPPDVPPLTRKDLDAIMEVLEQHLVLSPPRKREIASKSGLRRHIAVMKEAFGRPGEPPNRSGRLAWLDASGLQKMIQSISDEKIRQFIQSFSFEEQSRQRLVGMVIRGLYTELTNELQRQLPAEEELEKYWLNLDGLERDQIMNSNDDEKRSLIRHYLTSHNSELRDVLMFIRRPLPGRGRRVEGRFGGSGRSRDGSRGKTSRGGGGRSRDQSGFRKSLGEKRNQSSTVNKNNDG